MTTRPTICQRVRVCLLALVLLPPAGWGAGEATSRSHVSLALGGEMRGESMALPIEVLSNITECQVFHNLTSHTHFFAPKSQELVRAVVVFNHGLWSSVANYKQFLRRLAQSGFAVVAQDLRSHGCSRGRFEFPGVLNDILEVVQKTREKFPAQPLFIVGHSFGGSLSLLATLALQHTKEPPNGLILVSCGRTSYAQGDLDVPTLAMHGKFDTNSEAEPVNQLIQKVVSEHPARAKDTEFKLFNAGHNLLNHRPEFDWDPEEVISATIEWLRKRLTDLGSRQPGRMGSQL